MATRGFGVAGTLKHETVREIASAAEKAGYTTFWANDTPDGDGLAALAAAAEGTEQIRLAVGVIAVDRKPVAAIARRVQELELPEGRLVIGIGAGGARRGALQRVREAAEELRRAAEATVVVGALGPRMCQLAGEFADGVLLNWLTPEFASTSAEVVRRAAREAARPDPHIAGYVRVGFGESARARLEREAARYEQIPQYSRHFSMMGVRGVETSVLGNDRGEISGALDRFDGVLDETVVRAITGEDSVEAYLALVTAAAPLLRAE